MEHELSASLQELQNRVEAGDGQAAYELGWHYLFGPQETRDPAAGFRLMEKAADQGIDAAVCQLGVCHYLGLGTSPDLRKTVSLYEKAAGANELFACAYLGALYFYGWGVPRDHAKAASLLQKAVEQGVESARVLLGGCYLSGEGVRKNKRFGQRLIAEAEQLPDSPEAWYELGNHYFLGAGKRDLRKAMTYYQKAADAGIVEARTQIAALHFKYRDYAQALEILRRPDVADTPGAKLLSARCHAQGLGLEKNADEAARLYRSAAESGDPEAAYEWGCILDSGQHGIPRNRDEADQWLNDVAKKDYIWTRKKEETWLQLTTVVFCLFWIGIPFTAVAFFWFGVYEKTFDSPKNLLDNLEFSLFWLPAILLYFVGAFGDLRCARWGSVLMFFASVDMAFRLMTRAASDNSSGMLLLWGVGLAFLLMPALSACWHLAQKTYWRERKINGRRISFQTPIFVGAAVLVVFQGLWFLIV